MALDLVDIAKHLTNAEKDPLKVRIEEDKSLVVVAHNGMKFRFPAERVAEAEKKIMESSKPKTPQKKTASSKKAKTTSKTTTKKTSTKSKASS